MASYQQLCYCKKCRHESQIKTNLIQCEKCGSTSISKTWSIRFRYVNEEHKELQKRLSGFKTKKEADDAYIKFMATVKQYSKLKKETHDLTFRELYEEFKLYQETRIKESSLFHFSHQCNKHILPYFEKFKVKKITAKDILTWQNSLAQYSYKYKQNLRNALSSLLRYAERYYEIPNKLYLVDGFRKPITKKEMLIWTPEEFNQFIEQVQNPTYKTFFYTLYLTGARRGEIMATTWKDWNLEKQTLNIDKTFTRKSLGKDIGGKSTTPKNQFSIREISIPDNLNNIMKTYKSQFYNKNQFERVFDISETTIDRIKKEACVKANVKEIRTHDFRHSHASLLISKGFSIVAVAKRLGHGNIEQTLNTYSHLMPNEDLRLKDKLSSCLNF